MDLRSAAHRYLDVRSESGDELTVLCPEHEDTNPSARANVAKDVWVCFTCHASGKLSKLLDAVADGRLVISHELDIESLTGLDLDEPQGHNERWLDQFDGGWDYWVEERGLSHATVKRFRLGSDPETSYPTIPVRDEHGRVLGVTQRRTEKWARPKYLYPDGVSVHDHLFGLHEAKREHGTVETVYLTEGAVDAMALWEADVVALGIYGSHLRQPQVELLQRLGAVVVVLAFDDDESGDRTTWGWTTKRGKFIPGAAQLLKGFVVEQVDWSLMRGPRRPRSKSSQLDPAKLSKRKRRELVGSPLPLLSKLANP